MNAANAELVGIVRRQLPMRYYGGESWWSLQRSAALVRMADSVEAAMLLMDNGSDADGQSVVRSLYEQVVTFAWVAADPQWERPVNRLDRWILDARYELLKLHNDASEFKEAVLSDAEAAAIRRSLGMQDDDGNRTRDKPAPDRILPDLARRAHEADVYWSQRIAGLHPARHLLAFRGLYLPAYRVASQTAHSSAAGHDAYITQLRQDRYVVDRARPGPRVPWALVCPLFGMALLIAARQVRWIDEATVRLIVDWGT